MNLDYTSILKGTTTGEHGINGGNSYGKIAKRKASHGSLVSTHRVDGIN